ncbi:hypothetical protein J4228_03660 [Candidatus Woesearchaeota archaeon]|nr:hypothetical protein [Candidatus Woesearchaeota archaeon]
MERDAIRRKILKKLYVHRIIQHKHTSFDNLPKGFPSHLRGQVKEIAEQLIKEGLLLSKPTNYGLEVSLNHKRIEEIEEIIEEIL